MTLSRQRRYQLAHKAAGLCQLCSKPAWLGAIYCRKHVNKHGAMTGRNIALRAKWRGVNWGLSPVQIAKRLKVSVRTVYYRRSKRA